MASAQIMAPGPTDIIVKLLKTAMISLAFFDVQKIKEAAKTVNITPAKAFGQYEQALAELSGIGIFTSKDDAMKILNKIEKSLITLWASIYSKGSKEQKEAVKEFFTAVRILKTDMSRKNKDDIGKLDILGMVKEAKSIEDTPKFSNAKKSYQKLKDTCLTYTAENEFLK